MREWLRVTPFESGNKQKETWIHKDNSGEQHYSVELTHGKPVDILSLKVNMLEDFGMKVARIRESRKQLFQKQNLKAVDHCPVCGAVTADSEERLTVYGAKYHQCKSCTHYYVIERPSKEALQSFYSSNKDYQSTYADRRTTETRVRQVAVPKAQWTIKCFEKHFKRKPRRILDVGAGSGHFAYASRKLGIECDGIEISESGRLFCKQYFGLELLNVDFVEKHNDFENYDIITFWGVIEHTPYPLKMLDAASKALAGKPGLIVAAVPRWNCLGTVIQSQFPESIVRHLDPLGHINCFTDTSLATAFIMNNLDICAAWYYGMDAYELVTQMSYLLNDNNVINDLGRYIPPLQERLDLSKLSDEIVLAGKLQPDT